jgi:hypothetical protein
MAVIKKLANSSADFWSYRISILLRTKTDPIFCFVFTFVGFAKLKKKFEEKNCFERIPM